MNLFWTAVIVHLRCRMAIEPGESSVFVAGAPGKTVSVRASYDDFLDLLRRLA